MSISDEALIKWSADIRRFLACAREAYLEEKKTLNENASPSFEDLYIFSQSAAFYAKQEQYLETIATAFDYVVSGHVVTDFKQVYDKSMRKQGDIDAYAEHIAGVSPVARLSGTLDVLRDSLARKDAIKNN